MPYIYGFNAILLVKKEEQIIVYQELGRILLSNNSWLFIISSCIFFYQINYNSYLF
jgi:hypothetical protein